MTKHFHPAPLTTLRPLKLGLLTPHNTRDRQAFSGTAFHAAQALGATDGISLTLLGGHHSAPMLRNRLLRRPPPEPRITPQSVVGLDIVVGLVASPLLDRLARTTNVPFLHVTDATPQFLRTTYGWDIPPSADLIERYVSACARRVVYSSTYMVAEAVRTLGVPCERTTAIPFGINLETLPNLPCAVAPTGRVELLFVAADWNRKGGDTAIAVLERLRAVGVDARLTVVGHAPNWIKRCPSVITEGFLDKNKPRHRARLAALYARAHVFLLPTRADCTPMVLAEAMAHGTPVLATDTGGVGDLIGQGNAGRCMPQGATVADWADTVRALTDNPHVWTLASDAAADRARTHFTWQAWAREIASIARSALLPDHSKAA